MKQLALVLALALNVASHPLSAETTGQDDVHEIVPRLLLDDPSARSDAIDRLVARGKPDVAAALIQVMRFVRDDGRIDAALAMLTGEQPGKGLGPMDALAAGASRNRAL